MPQKYTQALEILLSYTRNFGTAGVYVSALIRNPIRAFYGTIFVAIYICTFFLVP